MLVDLPFSMPRPSRIQIGRRRMLVDLSLRLPRPSRIQTRRPGILIVLIDAL